MIAPARVAAYQILRRVADGSADLPAAVAASRETLTDERDRALATEIATGVQRWRAAYDHLAAHYARRPASRLDPEILDVLRLSIHQLLHLTRVPASAVVDDAVDLAKRAGKRSAAGFVNAVLRNVSRSRTRLPLPPRPAPGESTDAQLEYLTITLSHPRWLAARWLARIGFDRAEAWMRFNNEPAVLTVRANRLKTTRQAVLQRLEGTSVTAEPTRFAPDGLRIVAGHVRDLADAGEVVVQDEASQLVTLLAGPAPGRRVLDTCASPGGKTTAIAAAVGHGDCVIACDVRARRIGLLQRTVTTAGATNVRIVQADLLQPLPFSTLFNTVIVDAPCSGLGTLRRDPDIRWRRQERDLSPLAAAEVRMLDNAARVVAPGGRLVYATCSSEPEENEAVAAQFVDRCPMFRPVRASRAHPEVAPVLEDPQGYLRTEPDRHGLELFFGAVFERASEM